VRPAVRLSGIVAHDADHRLLECATAAQADYLVTGNTRHFRSLKAFQGVQIVTPRRFLDRIRPADSD
jgi:predicted nucleic acid-binding protein